MRLILLLEAKTSNLGFKYCAFRSFNEVFKFKIATNLYYNLNKFNYKILIKIYFS